MSDVMARDITNDFEILRDKMLTTTQESLAKLEPRNTPIEIQTHAFSIKGGVHMRAGFIMMSRLELAMMSLYLHIRATK